MISFGKPWPYWDPDVFPTTSDVTRDAYVVAPFWSSHDIRVEGQVSYDTHIFGESDSNDLLEYVSSFIHAQNRSGVDASFKGRWMLVATWKDVHPYPHALRDFLPQSYQEFVDKVSV